MKDAHAQRRACRLVALFALALTAALVAPTAALATDSVPMYRLYNQWSGEHLFTTDAGESADLVAIGWTSEGTAWYAPTSGTEVYRLFNPYSSDHHYTASADEYAMLQSIGWRGEDVCFYSASATDEGAQPIYRLFNKWLTQGTHLYTTDKAEYDRLGGVGWEQENVAFYGVPASAAPTSSSTTTNAEPQDATDGTVVYVSSSGKGARYHKTPDCTGLSSASGVTSLSLEEAQKEGYTPCHICYQ